MTHLQLKILDGPLIMSWVNLLVVDTIHPQRKFPMGMISDSKPNDSPESQGPSRV